MGAVIKIECSEELRREFKRISVDYGGYRETLKAFIKAYRENPSILGKKRRFRWG